MKIKIENKDENKDDETTKNENTNKLLSDLLVKKLKDIEIKDEETKNQDPKDYVRILQPKDMNNQCEIKASTAQHRVPQIIDYNTGTFWQTAVNADNDQFSYNKVRKTHWLQLEFKEATPIKEIAWYCDGVRDKEFLPHEIEIWAGTEETDCVQIGNSEIPNNFVGWHYFTMLKMTQSKKMIINQI